jgi:hypothetical protein
MNHKQLQQRLTTLGHYDGAIDGIFGPKSKGAVIAALTSGPDHPLTPHDVAQVAARLDVDPAKVWAVYDVESTGSAFIDGRPAILFEPHRFSKSTGHRYDKTHPRLSSRAWDRTLYPRGQAARYQQLVDAVALNVDAGFMSASYGGFQILGENYAVCDAADAWSFAWRQAQTEGDQLDAFTLFVEGRGLKGALRRGDWAAFARGYNGTAYRANRYDERLAAAYARRLAA